MTLAILLKIDVIKCLGENNEIKYPMHFLSHLNFPREGGSYV